MTPLLIFWDAYTAGLDFDSPTLDTDGRVPWAVTGPDPLTADALAVTLNAYYQLAGLDASRDDYPVALGAQGLVYLRAVAAEVAERLGGEAEGVVSLPVAGDDVTLRQGESAPGYDPGLISPRPE